MALSEYSKTWKNCATCAHWQGARELNESRDGVLVDRTAMGPCGGFWKGVRKYPNDRCTEYAAWGKLQEK